jgi:hypothetical protein
VGTPQKRHAKLYDIYVDKDSNDVIIKFIGFPNELASQLFITYAMLCIGFDFEPVDSMPSKKIH